ncbi:MAG TPA: energy transducer TonB [Blastocatellia bacterium]|nr:energy transducer TonB [Blastocatellia bacterium]
MPDYPPRSAKNRATGVSVTELEINEAGNVERVDVLQAPDEYIEAALINAISRWKFEPSMHKGRAWRVKGKLTFYFVVERGKARVMNPKFPAQAR